MRRFYAVYEIYVYFQILCFVNFDIYVPHTCDHQTVCYRTTQVSLFFFVPLEFMLKVVYVSVLCILGCCVIHYDVFSKEERCALV
jgi:hypothetical protein